LDSAKDDYKNERYDSCIGNLYYSAFQTVSALLIAKGDYLNKLTHVRAFVNKELAKNRLISRDAAKMYNKLMDYRSDADYNNEFFFDKSKAEEMLTAVEQFNNEVNLLIVY
jgi:uncharacterized protein (UPF0332 family)